MNGAVERTVTLCIDYFWIKLFISQTAVRKVYSHRVKFTWRDSYQNTALWLAILSKVYPQQVNLFIPYCFWLVRNVSDKCSDSYLFLLTSLFSLISYPLKPYSSNPINNNGRCCTLHEINANFYNSH